MNSLSFWGLLIFVGGFVLFLILVALFLEFRPFTAKTWNNGVCPDCGVPWEPDNDWESNDGWVCPRCLKHISIGAYWRRDYYKKKKEEEIAKNIARYDAEHSKKVEKNIAPKRQLI